MQAVVIFIVLISFPVAVLVAALPAFEVTLLLSHKILIGVVDSAMEIHLIFVFIDFFIGLVDGFLVAGDVKWLLDFRMG